ncbi:flagellar M-ring protein FliF [bacterium]|nr:flagellar M-ring protein FliF [bacterium]
MLEQLRTGWDNLSSRQRLVLVLAAAGTVIGLVAVTLWSSRPSYSTLYSGLSEEDAAAVVEELQTGKVAYRLSAAGGRIEVPTTALYETRLSLAGKGMPSRNGVGFELFDKSTLPGTDFSNTVNLQRALQGELSRTICSLSEVKSARVHLTIPHESLYRDQSPPTASVMLDLGPTGSLRPEQVKGIVYLVASAVEDLNPREVTVVDTQGELLSGDGAGPDLAETVFSTSKAYGEALTQRLQSMMDVMFGPRKTIVRAQAELNLDAEEVDQERVEPAGPEQKPAVSREHATEETYSGTDDVAGGVSGVPSNLLGTQTASGSGGKGAYRNSEETREYEFSKTKMVRKNRPGRVTRLTVAAVVDESLAAQGVDRVRDVLTAAAGVDLTRGDSIVVRPMKLKSAELADQEDKLAQATALTQERRATLDMLLRRGLPLVIVCVLLAVLVRTAAELRQAALARQEAPPISDEFFPMPEVAAEEEDASYDEEAVSSEEEATRMRERTYIAELQRVAREQPDILADELRNLVSGADGP